MKLEAQTVRGRTVVVVRGAFDAAALAELRSSLAGVAGPVTTIDFHDAGPVHDAAVAMLARDLERRPDVALAGLSEHHHRLMRYMVARPAGVAVASPA